MAAHRRPVHQQACPQGLRALVRARLAPLGRRSGKPAAPSLGSANRRQLSHRLAWGCRGSGGACRREGRGGVLSGHPHWGGGRGGAAGGSGRRHGSIRLEWAASAPAGDVSFWGLAGSGELASPRGPTAHLSPAACTRCSSRSSQRPTTSGTTGHPRATASEHTCCVCRGGWGRGGRPQEDHAGGAPSNTPCASSPSGSPAPACCPLPGDQLATLPGSVSQPRLPGSRSTLPCVTPVPQLSSPLGPRCPVGLLVPYLLCPVLSSGRTSAGGGRCSVCLCHWGRGAFSHSSLARPGLAHRGLRSEGTGEGVAALFPVQPSLGAGAFPSRGHVQPPPSPPLPALPAAFSSASARRCPSWRTH